MAVLTLFISYWDHFMRNFNLVCNSVHVFPRIAIKFCMCDFTPSTSKAVFSQFFHEISVSSEFFFDISAPRLCLFVCSSSVQRVVARLLRLKIEPTGPFSVRPTPNSRKCLLGGHIISCSMANFRKSPLPASLTHQIVSYNFCSMYKLKRAMKSQIDLPWILAT